MFVVQKHDATRLHFDFRIELDGVLKSWAVTKGPSNNPADKRLAVRVEDHPVDYGDFEGTIPENEYGGGTVMLWDRGTWEPMGDPHEGIEKGDLKLRLFGERMKGEWVLVHMKGRDTKRRSGPDRENWLLIKHADSYARDKDTLTTRFTRSVASGRDFAAIAKGAPRRARPMCPTRPSGTPSPKKPSRLPGGARCGHRACLNTARPSSPPWSIPSPPDRTGSSSSNMTAIGASPRSMATTCASIPATARTGPNSSAPSSNPFASLGSPVPFSMAKSAPSTPRAAPISPPQEHPFRRRPPRILRLRPPCPRRQGLDRRAAHLAQGQAQGAPRRQQGPIQYSEHVVGHGDKVLSAVCRDGHEGVIAKKADAPYRGERNRNWLKIKCIHRQEFVIGGWSPSEKRNGFASLLVGTWDEGKLTYRGRVGTGFDQDTLHEIGEALAARARKTSPFAEVPRLISRSARWVKPELVAEIAYTELTGDGILRHPSFIGLRTDKPATQVVIEKPAAAPEKSRDFGAAGVAAAERLGVRLTSPDRVVYPGQGITKADLVGYYEAVADVMLPHVADRPLSLVRCPRAAPRPASSRNTTAAASRPS